jgi:hypothetical protein
MVDRRLVVGILAGGLTLAVLSGVTYLVALRAFGVDGARTLALAVWLVGHASLGVVMGWERRPIEPRDLLANPAMLLWAGAAVVFAVAILAWPPLQMLLHGGPVSLPSGALVVVAGLVVPLWLEALKRFRAR